MPTSNPLSAAPEIEAQPDRLYGRRRGHALRPRQERLIAETLPRLAFDPLAGPRAAFGPAIGETWLEIGFGGGEHAAAQVAAHPQAGLIACEVFENGICSLLSRLVPEGADEATAKLPENLRIWPHDARDLLRDLPEASLDRAFLLFPDPWPKARHAKRRFVHPDNIALLARVIRPGGEWRIASDHPVYQEWVAEVLPRQTAFRIDFVTDTRPDGWPGTRYEAKAYREGRQPRWWSLIRA